MEHYKETALSSTPNTPASWYYYVDDDFLKWYYGSNDFTICASSNNSTKFTLVYNGEKNNGKLWPLRYQKLIYTDKFLYDEPNYHPAQKQGGSLMTS